MNDVSSHSQSEEEVDRPLTSAEHALVRWLLTNGDLDSSDFLAQLDVARVCARCTCGCASADFSIDGQRRKNSTMRVLADYGWLSAEDHRFGVFVFEEGGLLAGIDLYSVDGLGIPSQLPSIESLVPIGPLFRA